MESSMIFDVCLSYNYYRSNDPNDPNDPLHIHLLLSYQSTGTETHASLISSCHSISYVCDKKSVEQNRVCVIFTLTQGTTHSL